MLTVCGGYLRALCLGRLSEPAGQHCSSSWAFPLGAYINKSDGPVDALSISERWWARGVQPCTDSALSACKLGHSQNRVEWKREIGSHMSHRRQKSCKVIDVSGPCFCFGHTLKIRDGKRTWASQMLSTESYMVLVHITGLILICLSQFLNSANKADAVLK